MTPDWAAKPAAVPYAVLGDPQSLNLYTYVRNIPTVNVDTDGHETLNSATNMREGAAPGWCHVTLRHAVTLTAK
jgi:hypothetical protein